jgi:hypothetical protein
MAGRLIEFSTGLTEITLAAATVESIIEVTAPTNTRLLVIAWGISFDSILVTDEPVEVTLARKSVAGTGGTAATARDLNEDATGTVQSSAQISRTAEGTVTYDFQPRNIHPQGGFEIWYPEGKEIQIVPAGIFAIRANAPQAQDAHAWIIVSE